jgi:hypothetical protein
VDITKEDWKEWAMHPCTKAMRNLVEDAIDEARSQPRGRQSIDETIRNSHYVDGWCDGAGEIIGILEEEIYED